VTLSGTVPTDDVIRQVVAITEHITGIQQVHNQLVRK
jgi:osmotically-inducible protein OsmY